MRVNVCETLDLLKLAWSHGKKVVFTSTPRSMVKTTSYPSRKMQIAYGPAGTTAGATQWLKRCRAYLSRLPRRGLPVVILRFFNVYGPGADSSEYGGVLPRFISQALNDQPLTVHGDGNQTRSFTYISDIVRGTIAAGKRAEAEGKTFNLGSSEEISILELARLILQLAGKKGKIIFQPYRDFTGPTTKICAARSPTLQRRNAASASRLDSLAEGLMKTLECIE